VLLGLAKGAVAGMRSARQQRERTDWTLPGDVIDPVPLETAMLHRCRYKFPFAKARRLLGYEPVVSVEDGLIRAIRALTFAGHAIDRDFHLKLPKRQNGRAAEAGEPKPAPALKAPRAVTAA
jgi:hypothetical protein